MFCSLKHHPGPGQMCTCQGHTACTQSCHPCRIFRSDSLCKTQSRSDLPMRSISRHCRKDTGPRWSSSACQRDIHCTPENRILPCTSHQGISRTRGCWPQCSLPQAHSRGHRNSDKHRNQPRKPRSCIYQPHMACICCLSWLHRTPRAQSQRDRCSCKVNRIEPKIQT